MKFQCQGSGQCCLSRGEYGYVYLTKEDLKRFANYFGLSVKEFKSGYCGEDHGVAHLLEEPGQVECLFLKENQCSVYEARPTQCRTWPFWPENMKPKDWKKNVVEFCPGVEKGRLVSAKDIEKNLTEQSKADREIEKNS